MLTPWLALPGAQDRVSRWSALTGLDLVAAGTSWPAERIRDTAVAQPLLTAAALLSGRALLAEGESVALCGHSVGELPAYALAGVLSDDQAIALAARRGRAMASAAATAATGLAAVLGGDADAVLAAAAEHGLELATVNVAGQLVLGGPLEAVQALVQAPPPGARVRPLEVAGAFHTSAMQPAVEVFAAALAEVVPAAPATTLLANADGAVLTDGADAVRRLLAQLTVPVRFDLCLGALLTQGTTGVVELAPGGTLAALAKRALPEATVVALRTPDDLPAARALLAREAVSA